MSDERIDPVKQPESAADAGAAEPAEVPPPTAPSYGRWMGTMWLYTVLRFGMFFVLWGTFLLIGFTGLFAALVALVVSVPLSLVLLRKPRDAFTAQMQARMDARRVDRDDLAARLADDPQTDDPPPDAKD